MVVAAEYYRGGDFAAAYGVVEGEGYFCAPFGVGVENTCLRTYHKVVAAGFFNPVYVVVELRANVFGCVFAYFLKHACGYAVSGLEVGRIARGAHPAEGAEAIVEEQRTHYVLHVRGIAEFAVLAEHVGTGARRFEQEGVAVVEEIHAACRHFVDCLYLTAERFLNAFTEFFGLVGHHGFRFLERQADGIIAAGPGIVQRGLVGAEFHVEVFFCETFP